MNIFYAFAHMMLTPILKVLFRLEVKGKNNIPKKGGVIFAAHHESYLDPVVVGVASPRQINFLAREELFQFGFFSWIIKNLNAIPISREQLQISTAKKSLETLKKGQVLLLFPEGTRSEAGTIAEGKRGVGLIAEHANVPVIPVLVKGSGQALPQNRKWITPHKVTVIFGKPLYMENIEDKPHKETHQQFSDRVMEEMRKLAVT
ncbi:MAG: lysophospholipid acyltransferase family protein [Candidatus Ratteibacteria bacterium]|nr:lysophospholipid acyltransferase family protein [Candidatus Ratteibacteria bacterium]